MRAFATIHDSSGDVIGPGPVTTVTSVTYRQTLDTVGQATITMPATDTRAASLTAIRGRVTVKRPLADGRLTDMFSESVIIKKDVRDGPAGAELVLTCMDKVHLLDDANTLVGRKFKAATLDDVLTELLGLSSGFTHSFVDSGLDSLLVTRRFDGATVLQAVRETLRGHGLHWYAVGGTLYVTSGGNLAAGVLHNRIAPPPQYGASVSYHATIEEISVMEDAEGLVTRIIPLGRGDGDKALTMKLATNSSIYSLESATGPNGKLYYYFTNAAAQALYGTIVRVVKFEDIAPLDDSRAARIEAANQLYDAAFAHIERYCLPVTRYSVKIRAPNTAWGSFGTPRPGEKRRVVYRGYTNQPNPLPLSVEVAYLSVDEELWVTGIEETLNLEGYSARLELADTDAGPETPAGKIVNAITRATAGELVPQPDSYFEATAQSTNATNTSLFSIAIPENSTVLVTGHVVAARSDNSAALGGRFTGVFRRTTGGNVVKAVDLTNISEDSAGAPTFSLGVLNSSPTFVANFVYAGVASQTWNWEVRYQVIHLLG